MGTAILRPHDCLQGWFPQEALALTLSPVRSRRNSNSTPIPVANSYANPNRRRKRSPVDVQASHRGRDCSRCGDRPMVDKGHCTNLVLSQVKILKRGEKLSSENNHRGIGVDAENRKARAKSEENFDLVLGLTDRLGPEPEMVRKQIRVSDFQETIYAGSAFVASPPPSSVPVPGFIGKNGAATSDLRRLLRLDLV